MQDVMIDIETLGIQHSSVFLSIAAVPFDFTKKKVSKTYFYKTVDLKSAIDLGLTIDASTLQWWLEQKPHIMKLMFDNTEPVTKVLEQLSIYFRSKELVKPWGNSASFDLGILTNAYQKADMTLPWKFWDERCYRTAVNLFPANVPKKPENAHNPVADCYYQIERLFKLPL